MKNSRKITHFIGFSGAQVRATADNYAFDAGLYLGAILWNIKRAEYPGTDEHDKRAYALMAGQYARTAGHCARMALELGYVVDAPMLATYDDLDLEGWRL